jgi:cytochrome oxidase Cu insertion factor (SCO1/SenC/PrrC family)
MSDAAASGEQGTAGGSDPAASPAPPPLTAEQRSAAFAGTVPIDRDAALRAGRAPVPRRVVAGIAAALAVIGIGGVVVEHYFGNVGIASSATTTTISVSGAPPTPAPPAAPAIGAPLDAFIGLKQLGTGAAPEVVLREQSGAAWSLQAQTGKVVVLTFYATGCSDICPVLGRELAEARTMLGPKAADVEFIVVNSDPHDVANTPAPPALTVPRLAGLPDVHFLTGPLAQLNATWIAYGVTVTIGGTPSREAHNAIVYFVDPQGRLRSSALPFANEDGNGVYSLPAADIQRFAQGVAQTAGSLTASP